MGGPLPRPADPGALRPWGQPPRRERDGERAPLADPRFHRDPAAAAANHIPDEREAEPDAWRVLPGDRLELLERLEGPYLVVGRDPAPGVADGDSVLLAIDGDRDPDRARLRELDGVRHEVQEHEPEEALVGLEVGDRP